MILSKFSKRERNLLLVTIAIVLATISYGFIIEPIMGAYSKLNRQIGSSIHRLEKDYKLLRNKDVIEAEYKNYAELIKPLPSDEEEIASTLKTIEAVGRQDKIYITNIRPQPVKDKGFYKEFVFELNAEASLDQMVKFIYDLQGSGNLLRVTKLTINASSSTQKALRIVIEITKPSIKKLET